MTKLKSNLPSLTDLASDPALARPLCLEVIEAIIDTADQQKAQADAAKKVLIGELARRYDERIGAAYLREAKDTGIVHVADQGYDLACDRPKKVEWDQDALKAIAERIKAQGDDPAEYLDLELSMPEKRYTALPASLQRVFTPARTIKPGALSIKLAKLEGAK